MPFNWTTKLFGRQKAAVQTATDEYIALLVKGAEKELSDKDADRVATLAAQLGRNDIEADAGVAIRWTAAKDGSKDHDKLAAAAKAAEAARDNYVKNNIITNPGDVINPELKVQAQELNRKIHETSHDLKHKLKDALAALKPAADALEKLRQIEAIHWRWLGLDNPESVASNVTAEQREEQVKRYLLLGTEDEFRATYDRHVDFVASLVQVAGLIAGCNYVRAPGQSAEELDSLKAIASDRLARFIRKRGDKLPNGPFRAILSTFEEIEGNDPDKCNFYPIPGLQKQASISKMVEVLREKYRQAKLGDSRRAVTLAFN